MRLETVKNTIADLTSHTHLSTNFLIYLPQYTVSLSKNIAFVEEARKLTEIYLQKENVCCESCCLTVLTRAKRLNLRGDALRCQILGLLMLPFLFFVFTLEGPL